MMYPFYLFVAALIGFLVYSYRREILDKIGYQRIKGEAIGQSVDNLQTELQETADRIVADLAEQYSRLHILTEQSNRMADRLELLVTKADKIYTELEVIKERKSEASMHIQDEQCTDSVPPEDPRLRIVSQMAEHGMDIHEISNGTGIGYSEVRLLINIARKKTQAANMEKIDPE